MSAADHRASPSLPTVCAWCADEGRCDWGPPGTSHGICREHCIAVFDFDPEPEEKEAA